MSMPLIAVALSTQATALIDRLVASGLWGGDRAECVERIVCRFLEDYTVIPASDAHEAIHDALAKDDDAALSVALDRAEGVPTVPWEGPTVKESLTVRGPTERVDAPPPKYHAAIVPTADKMRAAEIAAGLAKGPCKGCGGRLGCNNRSGWCSKPGCVNSPKRRERELPELAETRPEDRPSPALLADLEKQAAELKASPEGLRGPCAPRVDAATTSEAIGPAAGLCEHGRPWATCSLHAEVRKLPISGFGVWYGGLILAKYDTRAQAEAAALTWRPAVKDARKARL